MVKSFGLNTSVPFQVLTNKLFERNLKTGVQLLDRKLSQTLNKFRTAPGRYTGRWDHEFLIIYSILIVKIGLRS